LKIKLQRRTDCTPGQSLIENGAIMGAIISLVFAILLFCLGLGNVAIASTISHSLCRDHANYICYTVKRGDTWQRLFHDPAQRDAVMRINRMNISLYGGMKIAIPKNLKSSTVMDYAPFPKQIDPPGEKTIIVSVNPKVLAWGAYNSQGTLQGWGPVSGGQEWCRDVGRGCRTSLGNFAIYQKQGRGCVSTKFPLGRGGAPMPYCMFFNKGFALHGSYDVPGYNASHGCVRIFIPDAKWLNQEFVSNDRVRVIVKSN
jgi:L,D-transpeptidase ErfK/SrfK